MATEWGNWAGTSPERFRVGIDLTVSSTTITERYYVDYEGSSINDNQTLTVSGARSEVMNFTNTTAGVTLVATRSRSGSYNTEYTYTATLTGTYTGASPTHTRAITVPYERPGIPGTPSVSSIAQTAANASWTAPSFWGGHNSGWYDFQYWVENNFAGNTIVGVTSPSYGMSGLAPLTTYVCRVRAKNNAPDSPGDWSGQRTFATLATAPTAPSGVSGARVSDTQFTVTWTRNVTADAPYDSQQVQRRIYNGGWGSWSTIATISGTSTSYSDTGTVANRGYEWRIVGINTGGSATSAASATRSTTPAAPTNVSAVKNAGGDIVVSWTNNAKGPDVERDIDRWDGSVWSRVLIDTSTATTWTDTAPVTAAITQYRVRYWDEPHVLASAFTNSNTVQLEAPPDPPSSLSPSGVTLDAAEDITLTWMHNPVDSSPQSQYQVRYRVDGGSWVELTAVVSTTSSHAIAGGTWANGTGVEWQVKTWGSDADPSAYSATASLTMSARPTATINSPADAAVLTTSTLTVEWGYFQAQSSVQSQWRATLLSGGATLEVLSAADAATEATFATSVEDGSSYTVRVEVASTAGLWSAADEVTVSVDYLPPEYVIISGAYDAASGAVVLSLGPRGPEVGVTEPAVAVDIWRRIDGGAWLEIASQVAPDATVLDTTATTRGTNEYQVLVWSATPSTRWAGPILFDNGDGTLTYYGTTWIDNGDGTVTIDDGTTWIDNGDGTLTVAV